MATSWINLGQKNRSGLFCRFITNYCPDEKKKQRVAYYHIITSRKTTPLPSEFTEAGDYMLHALRDYNIIAK